MNTIEYDYNVDYFLLYKQTLEENQKLRERITYPKLELNEQNECFNKKSIWIDMLLGDNLTRQRQFTEYDVLLENNKEFKEHIIDNLLREMGYKYLKNAYEYWENKNNNGGNDSNHNNQANSSSGFMV